MQPKEEIESFYSKPDPWDYQKTEADIKRREKLVRLAGLHGPYERCLDIGAGEGWITQLYPAKIVHGFEISDQAAARFPQNVKRVLQPEGKYDLICATGVFYGHYDWRLFMEFIKNHGSRIVLVSSMAHGELPCVDTIGKCLHDERYPYRHTEQRTRIFEVAK